MRELAIAYMKRGWPVFPVQGKVPMTRHGVLDATTDVQMALGWSDKATGCGLATGKASGLFVVDLDSEEARDEFMALAAREGGKMVPTVASRTLKGWHLFYRMPEGLEIRNSASKILPQVDIRGTGGYVVLPGSRHPDGGKYSWQPSWGIEDLEVADAPKWLLRLITQEAPVKAAPPMPSQVIEGARNETLTSLAGSMRRRDFSEAAIYEALRIENEAKCSPPLSDREVRSIAASMMRYSPAEAAAAPKSQVASEGLELIDAAVVERISKSKQAPISACPVLWSPWRRLCRGAGGGEGLAHGWHVVLGAPSGAGKSLFAVNFAAGAVRGGENVCMMSLEMSQAELLTRFLAVYSGFPVRSLEHGPQFDPQMWRLAGEQLQEAKGTLRINRDPLHSLEDIKRCFERHIDDGCKVFITDYLQLAWSKAQSMREQITEVSQTIRGLAREYEVLSFGLSQLNRATSTGNSVWSKEGLIGGSSLENDADQVLLLSKQERLADRGFKSSCKLDKNRHGMVGEWDFLLDTTTLRMRHMNEMGITPADDWGP